MHGSDHHLLEPTLTDMGQKGLLAAGERQSLDVCGRGQGDLVLLVANKLQALQPMVPQTFAEAILARQGGDRGTGLLHPARKQR